MALDREQVMAALATVDDPELDRDLVSLNMIKGVGVNGNDVHVQVELTTPACPLKDVIRRDVQAALQKIGAERVEIEFSARPRRPHPRRTSCRR